MIQVVSAFPGCGKSWFHRQFTDVLDSDSSAFDKSAFPQNYICHIRNAMVQDKCIFVSSHGMVRTAMIDSGIEYILVYPSHDIKEEFLERYRKRGSEPQFIELLDKNWDSWIGECQGQQDCVHVVLQSGQYLADVIEYDPLYRRFTIKEDATTFTPQPHKHKTEYIAVDFDGTIVTNDWPEVGKDTGAIAVLRDLLSAGCKLILHTVREGKELNEALAYCAKHGIDFIGVNENREFPPGGITTDKPYADVYIDDRAMGCPLTHNPLTHKEPYVDWFAIRKQLEKRGVL